LQGIFLWWAARRSPHSATRFAHNMMLAMMGLQLVLGVITVLYGAHWTVAILHQFGAVVLVALLLLARFRALYPVADQLRKA
jgi:cytochrome c oxidase assembly protein subunit 15